MDNRIIQGDCTAVLKTLPGGSVDFVLTDPPYFVGYRDRSERSRTCRLPRRSSCARNAQPMPQRRRTTAVLRREFSDCGERIAKGRSCKRLSNPT
jgi:DNA modification methylase